jgi:hypothetical protein
MEQAVNMSSTEDTLEIQSLLARFATSFDLKDWDSLQSCLAEAVLTDYSDLRGTPPATESAGDFVGERRESLRELKTHHLGGNAEISFDDPLHASCRLSMRIWRKSAEKEFNTHCVYAFGVSKIAGAWKISSITQRVLWNEGSAPIHSGSKAEK